MPTSSQTVFVHVGLGKTGTSTVQRALSEQKEALAELGIDVPGSTHADTRLPVYDLMGRRIGGANKDDNSKVTGAWKPFAASIRASSAPTVVFSEEMLALARPRTVKRLVDSLAPRRVVVIVTVRDLGRVLGSYWQQMVMMGRPEPLADFLRAVRDPDSGPTSAGVGFWMRQDVIRTLNSWESAVPRADIRVVTLPAPGQPPNLLNDRFAEVIGAPAGLLRGSEPKGNASLGLAETEVVRRLNEHLADSIEENQRLNLMRVIRGGLEERESQQIVVPAAEFAWIEERAAEMVAELEHRGYQVVGSLDDLKPKPPVGPAGTSTDSSAGRRRARGARRGVSGPVAAVGSHATPDGRPSRRGLRSAGVRTCRARFAPLRSGSGSARSRRPIAARCWAGPRGPTSSGPRAADH